jgi:AraC-like DNA-binding protein
MQNTAMHRVSSAGPSPDLRSDIRAYAQRELTTSSPLVEVVPARLEQVLNFEFADAYELRLAGQPCTLPFHHVAVLGYQTYRRYELTMAGTIRSFGIFFQPGGFSRLFHLPMHELAHQVYEARSVLGREVAELHQRLGEEQDFHGRIRIVEDYLRGRSRRGGSLAAIVDTADHILKHAGVVRVSGIADSAALSTRHFERRFRDCTGCSPKRFARVARFQTALDMKVAAPQRSWLSIAHTLYYHDQMHMVHDFERLAGGSPGRVLAELGDMRPSALAASHGVHP